MVSASKRAAYNAAYYAAHREEHAAYSAAHCEQARVRSAAWRVANPEESRAYGAAWRATNREKVQADDAAYRATHREEGAASDAAYRASHPKVRRASCARHRARKLGALGVATAAEIAARWTYHGDKCWMCGGEATCTDHVKPLVKGGSNWPANLRPACGPCNSSKGATWPLMAAPPIGGPLALDS